LKSHLSRLYRLTLLFYLGFPVTYLGTLALLYNIPGADLTKILLQPSYYLLSLAGVVTGWGLMDARRWSWYAMRFLNLAMIYFSVVMLVHYGQTNHSVAAFFISVVLVWLLDRSISSELRVPYFMPQISWWESDPRFQIRIPVKVTGQRGEILEGQILDLSHMGCFIKIRPEIPEQNLVSLECELFGRPWSSQGTVVWQTFGAVTFPRGLGVKFSTMDRQQKRALKAATLRVRKLSLLYRRGRYLMTDEELKKAIEKLREGA
jgi:PilZ domain